MALYDTEFGLPQVMADYLNQGLPSIQQPYRPGYDKNYGPGKGMGYTQSCPNQGINMFMVQMEEDIQFLYQDMIQMKMQHCIHSRIIVPGGDGGDGFSPYDIRPGDSSIRTPDQYSPYAYNQAMRNMSQTVGPNPDLYYAPQTGIEQLLSKIPHLLAVCKKRS
jgi:hypothetical protein